VREYSVSNAHGGGWGRGLIYTLAYAFQWHKACNTVVNFCGTQALVRALPVSTANLLVQSRPVAWRLSELSLVKLISLPSELWCHLSWEVLYFTIVLFYFCRPYSNLSDRRARTAVKVISGHRSGTINWLI